MAKGDIDLSFGFLSALYKGIIIMVETMKIPNRGSIHRFLAVVSAQQGSGFITVPDNQQQPPDCLFWLGGIVRDTLGVFLSTEPPLWGSLEPESCRSVTVCAWWLSHPLTAVFVTLEVTN
ncbi:hypothetical protein WISP_122333 [Willisornis vidua]|uniref:Uncharacterized protein n=1 Tax=Willisornis vidua TaxID=1566151 RepID=A0ABQ9CS83_9PASS|nr:hypothetical protein WISP_122333 [Willisornis vidua]